MAALNRSSFGVCLLPPGAFPLPTNFSLICAEGLRERATLFRIFLWTPLVSVSRTVLFGVSSVSDLLPFSSAASLLPFVLNENPRFLDQNYRHTLYFLCIFMATERSYPEAILFFSTVPPLSLHPSLSDF